jgi:hypothetical protein
MWALNNDRLTIGRDSSSDIFVEDPEVSRHHADLVRHGQDWSIIDAGSTNGTSVNGTKVRAARLQPGNRIEIGDSELTLRYQGADPQSPHENGPITREASRPSRTSHKSKFIEIRVSRRILWIGDEAYPLQNIARAQTAEVKPDRPAALRRYLKWMVLWVLLGAAATTAIKLAPRLSSAEGPNLLNHAGVGVLVVATVLAVISTIWLLAVFLRRTYYALVIETSGYPIAALVSRDETRVRQIVRQIMDAIDNPQAEFHLTIEKKHIGDIYNVSGQGNIGRAAK